MRDFLSEPGITGFLVQGEMLLWVAYLSVWGESSLLFRFFVLQFWPVSFFENNFERF